MRQALATLSAVVALLAGCGWSPSSDCGAPPARLAGGSGSAISAAIRYLHDSQMQTDQPVWAGQDYAGDWPQCFGFFARPPFVRDVSPFMAAFIHHALSFVTPANRDALDLTDEDIAAAQEMRRAAVELMLRFRAADDQPDAGTFGFWPRRRADLLAEQGFWSWVWANTLPGPEWFGDLAPINLPLWPPHLAITADADCTATAYAALMDASILDGGPAVTAPIEHYFEDWRDLGQVPRRNVPSWLAADSGAFLTWLAYTDDPLAPAPNDVDVVVNANVLHALGRYGRLDAAGVADSIRMINSAVAGGIHRTGSDRLSEYYPDNHMLHYSVARAVAEGGVAGLSPAAGLLMSDLLASAETDASGRVFWDRGDPHLNTALAAAALADGGFSGETLDRAIDFLVANQDPRTGAWDAGVFFVGRFDNGVEAAWVSRAVTTAFALEAICRHRLLSAGVDAIAPAPIR